MTTTMAPTNLNGTRHADVTKAQAALRRKRAIKQHVRGLGYVDGPREAARIIREVPEGMGRVEMGDLLLSINKLRKLRARPMLARERISVWCTVAELTPRQREAISSELEAMAEQRHYYRLGFKPLTVGERALLGYVAEIDDGGGVLSADISRDICIEPPTAGTRLAAMRRRGYVRSETGGKRMRWFITPTGRAEVDRIEDWEQARG